MIKTLTVTTKATGKRCRLIKRGRFSHLNKHEFIVHDTLLEFYRVIAVCLWRNMLKQMKLHVRSRADIIVSLQVLNLYSYFILY